MCCDRHTCPVNHQAWVRTASGEPHHMTASRNKCWAKFQKQCVKVYPWVDTTWFSSLNKYQACHVSMKELSTTNLESGLEIYTNIISERIVSMQVCSFLTGITGATCQQWLMWIISGTAAAKPLLWSSLKDADVDWWCGETKPMLVQLQDASGFYSWGWHALLQRVSYQHTDDGNWWTTGWWKKKIQRAGDLLWLNGLRLRPQTCWSLIFPGWWRSNKAWWLSGPGFKVTTTYELMGSRFMSFHK